MVSTEEIKYYLKSFFISIFYFLGKLWGYWWKLPIKYKLVIIILTLAVWDSLRLTLFKFIIWVFTKLAT